MKPLRRSAARFFGTGSVLLAGCAGDVMVQADNPDALPVDVRAIDHALVANAAVREGYGYEMWTSVAFTELQEWDNGFVKEEGRLGTALVLLSAGEVACEDVTGSAPPAGSSGVFFVYRWWTTAETDPGWVGEYGVGGVHDDEGTGRFAVVGSWTEAGALDWPYVSGTATLDAWGVSVEGVADLDSLDAEFTADICGEVESVP